MSLPSDPKARKNVPITRGVLDYFPDAIAAVAEVSRLGNEQHNPGQPLHWSREKSTDHADCIARHLIERGTVDTDGARHSAKLAWRALALLQLELEEAREADAKRDAEKRAQVARDIGNITGWDQHPRREPVAMGDGRIAMLLTPEEVAKAARGV